MTITHLRMWAPPWLGISCLNLMAWMSDFVLIQYGEIIGWSALLFMFKVLHSQNLPKVPGYRLITERLINSFWSSHVSNQGHVMSVTRNLRHLNSPNRNRKKLSLSGLNVKKKRKRRSLKILKYKIFQLTTCKCVRIKLRSLAQCFNLSLPAYYKRDFCSAFLVRVEKCLL